MEQTITKDSFADELFNFCIEMNTKDLKGDFLLKNFKPNLDPNKKIFSINTTKCPIEGIELTDLRIQRIFFEDDTYLRYDNIYSKMRRGLSLLSHQSSSEQKRTFTIARIGLPKFFDYQQEYTKEEEHVRKRVMTPIEQSKGPFAVYFTEKANGEHFQISFNSKYKAWIIGTKNVSMLARDEKDLEWYNTASVLIQKSEHSKSSLAMKYKPKLRFSSCIEYARKWFKIINENIKDSIEKFKTELADHTLIGEFVGNNKHQHVKVYQETDVVFYAIVDNNKAKDQYCLPLSESFKLFQAYNLKFVHYELSKEFLNQNDLKTFMDMMSNKILLRSIDDGGEGCVAYFITKDKEKDKDEEHIINLCKLKTFEYLFYRLLREKMKKISKKKLTLNDANEIIKKEALEILKSTKDKIDLEFYFKLSNYVFQYSTRDPTSYSLVWAKFISERKRLIDSNTDIATINILEIQSKLFGSNETNNFKISSSNHNAHSEDDN